MTTFVVKCGQGRKYYSTWEEEISADHYTIDRVGVLSLTDQLNTTIKAFAPGEWRSIRRK